MRTPAARLSMAAFAGLALLLSACGAPAATPSPGSAAVIDVVTSTNVYGDIVKAIGGDKVKVTPIITKTSQDPHSYEASAQDKLAVSKAKLVVENGGGYDDFLHKLADDTNLGHDNMVSAVEVSGLAPESDAAHASESAAADGHSHGDFNEHVWYSLASMGKLADAVAGKLSALDSASAGTFAANAVTFKASLAGLEAKLDALKAAGPALPVAVTEPVPGYLLAAAGLENKTPEAFSNAIEEGTDVPPAVLKETTELLGTKAVRLLAYNAQTEGPQTAAVKNAAAAAGVPVVDFTETLPEGMDYLQWMATNVKNLTEALAK